MKFWGTFNFFALLCVPITFFFTFVRTYGALINPRECVDDRFARYELRVCSHKYCSCRTAIHAKRLAIFRCHCPRIRAPAPIYSRADTALCTGAIGALVSVRFGGGIRARTILYIHANIMYTAYGARLYTESQNHMDDTNTNKRTESTNGVGQRRIAGRAESV